MWGKSFFAMLMAFGVIISVMAAMSAMAWFFAVVCGVTLWSMSKEKKRRRESFK